MPVIDLRPLRDVLGGVGPLSRGLIVATYVRGSTGAVRVDGADIVFPEPITVPIVDGAAVEVLDLAPTLGVAAVRLDVRTESGLGLTRHVAVPDVPGPVDFGALVDVDPGSFVPTPTVVSAWEAWRQAAEILRDQAVTAAADADDSADAAAGLATAAAGSATAASGSATAAAGSATTASGAATTATGAASTATTKAGEASADRALSEAARGGAETARIGAEAARDLALAGQFLGTTIADTGADANTLMTPGVYRFRGAAASASTNLPALTPGVLEVFDSFSSTGNGQAITQRFTPYRSATEAGRVVYVRQRTSGSFQPWRAVASQRVDNPAGQPGVGLYAWDDVNLREQRLQTAGVLLSTADLDTITYDGTYVQNNSSSAQLARNYPRAGALGVLEVTSITAGANVTVVQRYTLADSSSGGQGVYQRNRGSGGSWGAWKFLAAQRVSETAGRAIYTWDDLNAREQLIYGDTGWRELAPIRGWTADAIRLIRIGRICTLQIVTLNGAAATNTGFVGAMPTGFRISTTDYAGNPRSVLVPSSTSLDTTRSCVLDRTTQEPRIFGAAYAGATGDATLSWITNDPWPTSLPGTPVGTIPNL